MEYLFAGAGPARSRGRSLGLSAAAGHQPPDSSYLESSYPPQLLPRLGLQASPVIGSHQPLMNFVLPVQSEAMDLWPLAKPLLP